MDIDRSDTEFLKKLDEAMTKIDAFMGEKFVKKARQTNTYIDRTANLRNSIGYIQVKDGVVVSSMDGGGEGGQAAKQTANTLRANMGRGIVLVAGMNYAAAVEARGYDVISNSVNEISEDHMNMTKRVLKNILK